MKFINIDEQISRAFRDAYESHPDHKTDPDIALADARAVASALYDDGLEFRSDDDTDDDPGQIVLSLHAEAKLRAEESHRSETEWVLVARAIRANFAAESWEREAEARATEAYMAAKGWERAARVARAVEEEQAEAGGVP